MADTADLKSADSNIVWVRVPPSVQVQCKELAMKYYEIHWMMSGEWHRVRADNPIAALEAIANFDKNHCTKIQIVQIKEKVVYSYTVNDDLQKEAQDILSKVK